MIHNYFNPPESGSINGDAEFEALGIETSGVDYTPQYLLDSRHELSADEYFDTVREFALANSEAILEHWLPAGERRGSEYKAYNPLRHDSSLGSFSINVETGLWSDFATDDKGGDLVSLIQYLGELEFYSDAAQQVLKFLAGQATLSNSHPVRAEKAEEPPEYTLVMPIPDDVMHKRRKFFGAELGHPVAEWTYRDAEGRPLFFVLRFDLPGGKKEYRPYSYCVDRTGFGSWRFKAPTSNRPAYGLDRLAANPDAVVIFAEGEKAADACQRLFPECVAVTTMNGAKSPSKTDFSPFANRRVVICPDFDEAGIKYKDSLVELLRGVGATVVAYMRMEALAKDGETLPAGYDLADAEADAWTREKLEAIKDNLWVTIPQPQKAIAEQPQERSHDHSPAVIEPPRARTKKQAGKKQTLQEQVSEAVQELFDGHLAFSPGAIRGYRDGYWATLDVMVDVKKALLGYLGSAAEVGQVNSYVTMLEIMYAERLEQFQRNTPLICLRNGTLDPVTAKLLPHSPDHYLCNQVDIDFDPAATCPLWLQTLEEIFQPDSDRTLKIQMLQEFIGYCLVADTRYHKFLWLVGGGGNGKSLVLAILVALLGTANVSNALIERLDRAFVRAELQDKLVNISSEMSAEATVSDGYLKQIVSGDMIEAERKYQPSFNFKPYARLIASTNHLPRLLDHSDGFFRRALILRFNRQFAEHERDEYREQKLMAELPGILNWALEGRRRLYERGGFQLPPSAKAELDKYRIESDPVRQFGDDLLVESDDRSKWVPSSDVYRRYVEWSQENGYRTLSSIEFAKRLESIGFRRGRNNQYRYWEIVYSDTEAGTSQPSISSLAENYAV